MSPSLTQIVRLEAESSGSEFNPNPLLPLIVLARHDSPQVVHKAIWALHRVFIKYIKDDRVGVIVGSRGSAENEDVLHEDGEPRAWVRDRMFDYLEIPGGLLSLFAS